MRVAMTSFAPVADRRLFAMAVRLGAIALLSTLLMLIKLAGEAGVSLVEIMFWRQFAGLPVVLAIILAGPGLASLKTSRVGKHATRSAMGLVGMVFNFGAVLMLPLAEATAISYTIPLFAVMLSAWLLRERVGVHRWAAVCVGFVGVLIVVQPTGSHIPMAGAAVGLTAAVLVALISIQVRDLTRTEPSMTIVFWFGAMCSVPLAFIMPFYATAHSAYQWGLLIAIGVIGALGQIGLTTALRYAPVSTVIGMDYSSLIWATLFGWLIWDKLPPSTTWIGAPIIIASGLYIAWREHKLAIARTPEVSA
jgi:drug/metabolite transporter (DMT)-like permease